MAESGMILINGLSIGGGGGLTVGIELTRALAQARPGWAIGLLLTRGHPLHEEASDVTWPAGVKLIWADPSTRQRQARDRYEARMLPKLVEDRGVRVLIQLNGMMPCGRVRVPVICHHQDPWPYRYQAWFSWKHHLIAWFKRRRHRRSLRDATWLTFTSEYLMQTVTTHHGFDTKRCSVLPNGLPDHLYEEAHREQIDPRADEILTVSNVSPYKQQWRVIEALAELDQRGHKGVSYRVLGGGAKEDLDALVERAKTLGLSDRVAVEGRVATERITWAYRRARIFALPSQCESFGIPAIEAMAFGVPVVVADCCALPEVTGDAALHADPDSTTALANAIERLLTDRDLAKTLIERGRERIHRYRWSDSGVKLAEIIEKF
ncbi:MAG: glycosyltransferase family 1 protein [Phycisphaeraceae bacterium]